MSDTPPASWTLPSDCSSESSSSQSPLSTADPSASTSSFTASQLAPTAVNTTLVRPVKIVQKLTCTGPDGCKSCMVAAGCSRQWCKRCCLRQPTPCGFRAHDQSRMALRTGSYPGDVQDPFKLTQPRPAIPPTPVPPTSSVTHDILSQSGHAELDSVPAPRSFKTAMPASLQRDWDTRQAAWMSKTRAEEMRRKNLLLLDHTIHVHIWSKDNLVADVHTVQDIEEWPTFSLVTQADILRMYSLDATHYVWRYNLASRTWRREKVSTAIKVSKDETVLFRLDNVRDCFKIDDVIAGLSDEPGRVHMPTPRIAASNAKKRPLEEMSADMQAPPATAQRLSLAHRSPTIGFPFSPVFTSGPTTFPYSPPILSPPLLSPLTGHWSPSFGLSRAISPAYTASPPPPPSPAPSSSSSGDSSLPSHFTDDPLAGLGLALPYPGFASTNFAVSMDPSTPSDAYNHDLDELSDITVTGLPPADMLALAGLPLDDMAAAPSYAPGFELDTLWEEDKVAIPRSSSASTDGPTLKWPEGIYARDMAKAFELIGEHRDKKVTLTRFEQVFQGMVFKSATFYAQRDAWRKSTEAERAWVVEQPRTQKGLWTACRAELSGWKNRPRHR